MYFCGKSWTNLDKFLLREDTRNWTAGFPHHLKACPWHLVVGCVCWLWAMGKLVGMWLKKVAQTKADLRPMSRERTTLYLD